MTEAQQSALNKYYHNTKVYEQLAKKRVKRWLKAVASSENLEQFANELLDKKNTWI